MLAWWFNASKSAYFNSSDASDGSVLGEFKINEHINTKYVY